MSDCSDCQHNDGAVYNQSCAECEDYSKWESKMTNSDLQKVRLGAVFERLTVHKYYGIKNNRDHWVCFCSCGKEAVVSRNALMSGNTKSCGCLRLERLRAVNVTHDMTKTKVFRIWTTMRRRCASPTSRDYPKYGGRGITVCQRWQDFANFAADMGDRPAGYELDRIDNDGDYSPNNCRWATRKEQVRNRHVTLMYGGKPLAQIAEEVGEKYMTVYTRFKKYGDPFYKKDSA